MSDADIWIGATAPRRHPTTPRLLRTLWILVRRANKSVTAGIFESRRGRELRVYYGQDENNIISTSVLRTGDAPLERQAADIRTLLEEIGWKTAATSH